MEFPLPALLQFDGTAIQKLIRMYSDFELTSGRMYDVRYAHICLVYVYIDDVLCTTKHTVTPKLTKSVCLACNCFGSVLERVMVHWTFWFLPFHINIFVQPSLNLLLLATPDCGLQMYCVY